MPLGSVWATKGPATIRIRVVEYDTVPAAVLRRVERTIRSGNHVLRRAGDTARYREAKTRRSGPRFFAKVER